MRAPTQPRVRASQRKKTHAVPATTKATGTTARTVRATDTKAKGTEKAEAGAKRASTSRGRAKPHAGDVPAASKSAAPARSGMKSVPVSIAPPTSQRAGDRGRTTAQFSERLAERRAAVRRLRWRTIALITAGAVLLAALAYVVLFSPLLALRSGQTQVSGTNQIVSEEEVLAIAASADGTPLARLDTVGLAEELGTIVGVREAHVQRDWPHGLQISIEPRVPVATVADGEEYVVLDGEGVELRRSDEAPEDIPQVDVPLGEESTAASLTAVLEVLDALPDDLLAEVATASAASPNRVQLELADGADVFWGSSAENALKVRVLQTLLQQEATGYDVSAPRAPITTGEAEE